MAAIEEQRASELLEAQAKAETLFHEVEARGLIRPGITEKTLNTEIYALAQEMFGITTYWHKRIVRAGKNTLLPYDDNPPDLTLGKTTFSSSTSVLSSNSGRRILAGRSFSAPIL